RDRPLADRGRWLRRSPPAAHSGARPGRSLPADRRDGACRVRPGQAIGAPDHPHRGFETVTYILEGEMEHEDSAGHRGVLGPGDVQWMTAGAGLIHSEMPTARV